ncbi:fungal-specific transcription factor domain-containing protein [Xylariaceae sp. FL1272]|nr:fungal-specific transcription factor domain-containing protein [Xylariaceae sp. FL1272]
MSRRRACDVCYQRKIQCSITDPGTACDWCGEHALACTFTREPQRTKRSRLKLSDVEGLFDRVEQLENALSRATAVPPGDPLPNASSASNPPSQSPEDTQSPASSHTKSPTSSRTGQTEDPSSSIAANATTDIPFPQYWYCRGVSLLTDKGKRYIFSKTSRIITFDSLRVALPRISPHLRLSVDPKLWDLPPKDNVRNLADSFLTPLSLLGFPVLDKTLFNATIETAYNGPDGAPSSSHAVARACVLATVAMLCRREGAEKLLPYIDIESYAARANFIVGCVPEETSLAALETLLILQRHHTATSHRDSVTPLHAVACRMVCALGGHVQQPSTLPTLGMSLEQQQAHHLRTLFWLCYAADKDISLRSGQPPLLTEEYCDLSNAPYNIGNLSQDLTHSPAPWDVELCRFKEKVYRFLYSPQAFKANDGILLGRIRELDDDLEAWRLSIHAQIRPKLSIVIGQLGATAQSPNRIKYVHLQLEYHYLMIAIHSAIRRCGADTPEGTALPDDLHSAIHSSCDLYLEASRANLTLLKESVDVLAGEHISRKTFMPLLDCVTLFIDIIAHPGGAQAHVAVAFLASAMDLIDRMATPNMATGEMALVKESKRFISELIGLGRAAIAVAGGSV